MAEPKLSIKQMKESIREAGLPTADLLERGDIDARYAEAVARLAEADRQRKRSRSATGAPRCSCGAALANRALVLTAADCGAPTPSITWPSLARRRRDDADQAACKRAPIRSQDSKFDDTRRTSWARHPAAHT